MKTPMKLSKSTVYFGLFLALGLSLAQQPAPVQPGEPVKPPEAAPVDVPPGSTVVTIGTEKLTRAQFEQILAALAENGRAATTPAAKRQVAEQVGEIMALAQEARKRKLDQAAAMQQMIAIQTDRLLADSLARQVSGELKIDDAALKDYYAKHAQEYEEAKAVHILIRFKGSRVPLKPNQKDLTEEEALAKAQEVRKQILAGGDFAAIAKAESDDKDSGANGGSLGGLSPRGRFVPEFDAALFKQPVGEVGEPVKSMFGYHIIKVEERKAKTFEEARADIEKKIKPQMTREAMDKIGKQNPVTLDENYFGK